MKQKVSLLLTFLLILTLIPITALAEAGDSPFKDVSSGHWAFQHIIKMEKRGVITGYGNGEFSPNKPVTQLEAVVMAVRAMGLEDEAKTMNTSIVEEWDLNLPNSWGADSYVAMAIDKELIDKENFSPYQAASRSWTAVLIIKMIGAEDEVDLASKTEFYDDNLILPQAKGYVALAAEKGIITGFYNDEDNLIFDPNNNVTRVQLATMISKSDSYMQDVEGQFPLGKITEKNGQYITIMNQERITTTYKLSDNLLIFNKEGKKATESDLQSNIIIRYSLDSLQNIDYIEFVDDNQWQGQSLEAKGTIVKLYTDDNLLTIKDENGKFIVYSLMENVEITNQSSNTLTINDLNMGDEILYSVNNNIITKIELTGVTPTGTVEGTIYSIDTKTQLITIKNNEQYIVYPFTEQTYVEYKDVRFPTINDLQQGDLVELEISNDQIQIIRVIEPLNQETLNGKIVTISNENQILTIRLDNGDLKAFELSEDAKIIIKGKNVAILDDLKIDDNVNIIVDNGLITNLEVTNREFINSVSGKVKSIDIVNKYITIEDSSGELKVFPVDPYVKVNYDEDLSDINVGMEITAQLSDNIIYAISTDTTIKGTFLEIDEYETFITIKTENNKRETYRLDGSLDVNIKDVSRPDISDIEMGQVITLEFAENVVTRIDAEITKTLTLTDINETRKRITVEEDGDDKIYSIYSYTELVIPDISNPVISDLNKGDTVKLTFTGYHLTSIEVLQPTYGKIKSIETYRNQLIVINDSGESNIDLNKTISVYNSNKIKMSLNNLKNDDYIKIVELDDEIIITQAEKVYGKLIAINGNDGKIYTENNQNDYEFYNLSETTSIMNENTDYYLGDLQPGDNLTLYIFDDLVIAIEVN